MRITSFLLLAAGTLVMGHAPSFLEKELLRLAAGGTISYKPQLGCGACLKGNYVYCVKGEDGMKLENETQATSANTICCQDATCAQASDVAWTCSN